MILIYLILSLIQNLKFLSKINIHLLNKYQKIVQTISIIVSGIINFLYNLQFLIIGNLQIIQNKFFNYSITYGNIFNIIFYNIKKYNF
jgi:hypothetical protein